MEKFVSKKGVSVYAYQGDAMTLLAFDLDKKLTKNFVGFTIQVRANNRDFFIYNRLQFASHIKLPREPTWPSQRLSTEFSPIQKFRWIHVPSTIHYVENPFFGDYTYKVTPRYIVDGVLLPIDKKFTVEVTIPVGPFKDGLASVGFTRSFISSQAFVYHFGNNLQLRPDKSQLTFNINDVAGSSTKLNPETGQEEEVNFTFEEIHQYLGWQARDRITDFLDEVVANENLCVDVFAYDLNEPVIVKTLLKLTEAGRARVLLDDYPNHVKPDCFEMKFDAEFRRRAKNPDDIQRGHFKSQSHSKIFILRNVNDLAAQKVLTGSTNFTTNGLYVNANHVLIFNSPEVAQVYADVFDESFSSEGMSDFNKSEFAKSDYDFTYDGLPDMTIRFSPHPAVYAKDLFDKISTRISSAESDVLFAIMSDESNSSILDAVRAQVLADNIFTAGITDEKDDMQFYTPGSKAGIRISGLDIATNLPQPFRDIIKVPGLGHNIHHKFIVVDFKGTDPVVYCGSSNLAFNPEQKNGDNLLEIRDKDIVTAFAIEAIRLIDHFHWLNRLKQFGPAEDGEINLYDNTETIKWYERYYDPLDLRYLERKLLIR